MNQTSSLVVAMAERCRALIRQSGNPHTDLPQPLHPRHLLWMCDQISARAEEWPSTKQHRWIGFIQCGMLANRMLDLKGAKAMFDEAKKSYADSGDDEDDLLDHLDPDSSFRLDLGGQG